jgi:hypothetical protein
MSLGELSDLEKYLTLLTSAHKATEFVRHLGAMAEA